LFSPVSLRPDAVSALAGGLCLERRDKLDYLGFGSRFDFPQLHTKSLLSQ